jgi:hypothetical protein
MQTASVTPVNSYHSTCPESIYVPFPAANSRQFHHGDHIQQEETESEITLNCIDKGTGYDERIHNEDGVDFACGF